MNSPPIIDIYSRTQTIPQSLIQTASETLLKGQIIATPTDTIYGLAACAQNKQSIESIYKIKGRASLKPIAICLAEIEDVYTWAHITVPIEILRRLLPGPVTLLFDRKPLLNPEFNPGTNLVGIRIPDHPFIREVCRSTGEPIALTSANKSSAPSSLNVEEFEDLFPYLGAIFREKDVGQSSSRAGSTIVELSKFGEFKIIREGCAFERTVNILKELNWKEIPSTST